MVPIVFFLVCVLIIMVLSNQRPSYHYPDGKCYVCRRGSHVWPGDICKHCGAEQL